MKRSWLILLLSAALILHPAPVRAQLSDCAASFDSVTLLRAKARKNPFFAELARAIPTRDLQWFALDAVSRDENVPAELRQIASDKIRYFKKPESQSRWDTAWSQLATDEKTQSAMEYCLSSFTDPGFDSRFRELIFGWLRDSTLSGFETIRALLPAVRGVRLDQNAEMVWSVQAVHSIAERVGSYPERLLGKEAAPVDAEDELLHDQIESIKPLGGGINVSLLVKFVDGHRGVFKPREGENNFHPGVVRPDFVEFVREETANPIIEDFLGNRASREAGKSPISVPLAEEVVLVHDGKVHGIGSLQTFSEGYFDLEKIATRREYREIWKRIMNEPAWRVIENRIRTIDFIQGNFDRLPLAINHRMHPKNIMIRVEGVDFSKPEEVIARLDKIDWSKIRVSLIDNGLGRNTLREFDINSFGHFPLRADIPDDLKQTIMNFDEQRFRKRFEGVLPEFGITDLIDRVHAAQHRIQNGP